MNKQEFKIENTVLTEEHVGAKVTYVPRHANGDASHKDCESGTIMRWHEGGVFVNYVKNKCLTPYELLVWG